MLKALAGQRAIAGGFLADFYLASIAAAHSRARRWDEALRCVDEGLALTAGQLEQIYVAESWRIKAVAAK